MSHAPAPYSSTNSGLAKGAAVAAIIYLGLLLLLGESIVLFAGSVLTVALRGNYIDPSDLPPRLASMSITTLLVMLGLVILLVFGIPLVLSIWMLVAARRNNPGQVLTVLVIHSVFAAISLASQVSGLASGSHGTTRASLTLLVWLAILALGWAGWSRMRQAPTTSAVDHQGYYQASAVAPTQPAPVQQYGWAGGQHAQGAADPNLQYPQYPEHGQGPSYGQYGQQPGAQSPYQGYADPGAPGQRNR